MAGARREADGRGGAWFLTSRSTRESHSSRVLMGGSRVHMPRCELASVA
jgi:hypothetical protein